MNYVVDQQTDWIFIGSRASYNHMKSNSSDFHGFRKQQSTDMIDQSKANRRVKTKLVVVNPITKSKYEDIADLQQSASIHNDLISQSTTEILRQGQSSRGREEQSYQYMIVEEDQDSSTSKLNKQMIIEIEEQEPPNFLYQSDRGEPKIQPDFKLSPVKIKEDEKLEADIMKTKKLTDILFQSIPAKGMIECVVKIDSSVLSMEKKIELYLLRQKQLILRAKKSRIAISSEYAVFTFKEYNIATFLSNPSRTEYKYLRLASIAEKQDLKSQKSDQTKTTYDSSVMKLNPVRVQLSSMVSLERSYIAFRPNAFGTKQQNFKVIRPRTKVGKSLRFSDIKSTYQNFQYDRLQIFESKMAEINSKGDYFLDFKTNNMMESAKNAIVEDQFGNVCLAFYRRKQNVYMLSIMKPLTLIEGFFIAVSNIDHLFF